MLTSLVSLRQRYVKKKSIEIVNIAEKKSSYLLDDLRHVVEIFRKNMNHDIIKSHKNSGFHPFPRKHIFVGGVKLTFPVFFGLI